MTTERQPRARRKLDLELDVLSKLRLRVRIYEASAQTNIVNTSLMPAGHALPSSLEENTLSLVTSSLT